MVIGMGKVGKNGSTPKQIAYARRMWGGEMTNRKQLALDVGYSPSVANVVGNKIEKSRGFQNAMANLAAESNSLALTIMHEFKARGVQDFSNKDLIGALNAIGSAWGRFNNALTKEYDREGPNSKNGQNRLRTVILQQIENQTVMPSGTVLHDGVPTEPGVEHEDLGF
jgi:hypothetical protein